MNKNITITKKIILTTLVALIALGGLSYYYVSHKSTNSSQSTEQEGISDYQEARDRQDILNMFVGDDRYWLLSSEDYDTEFMLDYKAPSKDPMYVGKAIIKVLRENGKFAGFTLYYKSTITEGHILFIAVKKEFRGKGNAQKLVKYAFDDLVRLGAKRVWLLTRAQNYPAQAVYKKAGFEVTEVDPEGYIYFHKFAQ